jgi:hypothetical protein
VNPHLIRYSLTQSFVIIAMIAHMDSVFLVAGFGAFGVSCVNLELQRAKARRAVKQ